MELRAPDVVLKSFAGPDKAAADKQGTLVLLPFAGGKADMYKDWHHLFPRLRVLCVNYRGRFPDGIDDKLLDSCEQVAQEVRQAMEAAVDPSLGPLFIYGHSFGALIGWMVAGQLQLAGHPLQVRHLFVGGEQWPGRAPSNRYAGQSLAEFAKQLVSLGLMPDMGQLDETMAPVVAATKAEFDLDSLFSLAAMQQPLPKLTARITAFYEAEDESFLTVDDVEPWQEMSAHAEFDCIPIYGSHLFCLPEENEDELVDYILEYMRSEL